MTNDIKISRELAEYFANSSDFTLKELNAAMQELRSVLDAPVVERTSATTEYLIKKLAEQYPDSNHRMTVEDFASWLTKNAAPVVESQEPVAWMYPIGDSKNACFTTNALERAGGIPLYASPPAPVAVVPEGWKLVPIEPTDDMIVAFAEAWYSKRQTIDDPDMLDAYRDMLAVAPACELNQ